MKGEHVYIVGAARTPLGSFLGALSQFTAPELAAEAIKAALERATVSTSEVGEVFLGNVCSAGLGQAPARQAVQLAGLPDGVDGTGVNKVCSSGMKATALGAQAVACGMHEVVVTGGMESMSRVPHYLMETRRGIRLGNASIIDGLVHDGLTDSKYMVHMGLCAEKCAKDHGITREQQDEHAIQSASRAKKATEDGIVEWEIVPIQARPLSKLKLGSGTADEFIKRDEPISKMDPEKLRKLPAYFKPGDDGTVTAGNASPITDGAAALVLASQSAVDRLNLKPLARILGFADAAQDPMDFPTSPSRAIPKALAVAGIAQKDVDYWEINEAFSVVDLANQKILGLDPSKVNVFGGAVAIGHPIGASGARQIVTLLNVLRFHEARLGVASICNGGGGASAIVIERLC